MLFIILFGIVSLFSDMTHEGASSIRGAYLSLLGASAATIGFISGLGELVGYSMRYVFGKLTDKSCDDETVEKMEEIVMKQEGVLAVDDIKTRIFGAKIYTDVEIAADGNLSLYDAHGIAERVHNEIEKNFPDVKHCMVHVNPYKGGQD